MCKNDKITINPHIEDRSNIFRELTLSEMKNIEKYVDENFNLNRSSFYNPIHNTVSIQNIELYLPNKEGALNFLDKSGKQPERQARVTIVHYPFNVTYYIIGPLPNPTHHKLLKFNDRENPLSEFATGMYRLNRASKLEKFSKQTFIDILPLMKDTYEDFEEYATPEDLFKAGLKADIYANQMNRENELSMRISWIFPKNYSHYVHANKFSYISVFANISSINESEWDIFGVSINLFSTEELILKAKARLFCYIFKEWILVLKIPSKNMCKNFFRILVFCFYRIAVTTAKITANISLQ